MRLYFMALDCDDRRFFSTGAFQRRWPVCTTWHIFSGGPEQLKQAETNCSRRQNTSYSHYKQRKQTTNEKKFSLHYIINVSMRACRRWEMTKMIRTIFQINDLLLMTKPRSEMIPKFCLMLNYIPVWSVSSTRSTAYINIKNILIAMVFVLHVF